MGKAVPKGIKSKAHELLQKFPKELGKNFEANKEFINSLELPYSTTTRNLIAGFIVRQAKEQK